MRLGFDRSSISHISKPLSAICEKAKAVDSAIPPNLRTIFLQSYANNKEKTRKAVCFFHFDFESTHFAPFIPNWSLDPEQISLDGWANGLSLAWRHGGLRRETTKYVEKQQKTSCQQENERGQEVIFSIMLRTITT